MNRIVHYILHTVLVVVIFWVMTLNFYYPKSCLVTHLNYRYREIKAQEFEPQVIVAAEDRPLVLVFSGDLMQHMPQLKAAQMSDSTFDYSGCFGSISKLWRSADFAVVNFETTISRSGRFSGYPFFSAPEGVVRALAKAGVSVATLANNHVMDKGAEGLEETFMTCGNYGISCTGAYADSTSAAKILYLKKAAHKVALLNYTYSINGMPVPLGVVVNRLDTVLIKSQLEQCRRDSATTVIVYYHFGEEYARKPSQKQIWLAKWTRRMGADLVVGAHPHVVQRVDTASRIAYSLGNLVSNQEDMHTDYGISLKVEIATGGEISLGVMPHWVDKANGYRILLPSDTLHYQSETFKTAINNAIDIAECDLVEL